MLIVRPVPPDLERRSLPDRLRFWRDVHARARDPNLRLIATLEEAATEVELGQRTPLTYRGDLAST